MHPLVNFYCFILKDYLETKRLVFARFYFLSNEDLLDILANSSKNPDAVQVCMIFDPLKYKLFLLLWQMWVAYQLQRPLSWILSRWSNTLVDCCCQQARILRCLAEKGLGRDITTTHREILFLYTFLGVCKDKHFRDLQTYMFLILSTVKKKKNRQPKIQDRLLTVCRRQNSCF